MQDAAPQVMMRIGDPQFRFDNRFFVPVEPIPANRVKCPSLLLCERTPRKPSGRRTGKESGEFPSFH
jgi:hypothetical protein